MSEIETTPLGLIPIEMIQVKDRYREDKGEIEPFAENMKEVGQITPIVVAPIAGKAGRFRLLAGERRILAAKHLGWETIRAELRAGDTTEGKLNVELSENVQRKAFHWPEIANLERAIFELRKKKDKNYTLRDAEEDRELSKTAIGRRIQMAKALDLLPELAECETQDEAWKAYKKLEEAAGIQHLRSKVAPEVLEAPQWASDHYRVSDCITGMAELEAETFDFAEFDPPYAIDLLRRKARNEGAGHTEDYNEILDDDYPAFMKATLAEMYRLLKPNGFAVVWYAFQWHGPVFAWLKQAGFAINPVPGIWYKGQSGQTAQPDIALASCYEPFFLARKGQPRMMKQGRSNVFHFSTIPPSRKIHPTERPPEMLDSLLETICFPGSKILVPCLGSGATLRAAYRGGHTGVGFDLAQGNKDRFLRAVAEEFGKVDPDAADIEDISDEELEEEEID